MASIYLASRFERREELRPIAAKLTEMGHRIVSEWIWTDATREDEERVAGLAADIADRNMWDLANADLLVLFAENDGGRIAYGGGRYWEAGVAWAWHMQIFLVGEREMLFLHLPEVEQLATVDALYERLEKYE